MNEGSAPPQEGPAPGALDERDILPLKLDERDASNPMGTVLNFLGIALVTGLTIGTLNVVGSLEGGLDIPSGAEAPTAGLKQGLDFEIPEAMSVPSSPTPPSFTA